MRTINPNNIKFFNSLPTIILFLLVFTGFDLSFFFYNLDVSFNFIYLIIFFFVLKSPNTLSYGLVFIAGIINDVVQNFPIGISSINYLLLCAIAAFIRSRMIFPNLMYDTILFLISLLIVSSVNYTIITMIFSIPIKYATLMLSAVITSLIYPLILKLLNEKTLSGLIREDD